MDTGISTSSEKHEEKLFSLEKKDFAFAALAVVFGIFTAVFGIFGGFALGYFISCLLTAVLFGVYFAKGSVIKPFPLFCGALSLANASAFICTSNESVRFFSVAVSFFLGLICFDNLRYGTKKGNRETLGIFFAAMATPKNVTVAAKSLFVGKGNGKKTFIKALIGLVCAIPVLFVVIPLLISSDFAFSGLVEKVFGNFSFNAFQWIFGVFLSAFMVSYGFSMKKGHVAKAKESKFLGIDNAYLISFLSAIASCYLLYLFSQLAYFFSAFGGFLPDGQISYAAYARKGFFEMCIIAVINLAIVLLALLVAKKKDGKASPAVKALTTFVAVFTLIIIATAVSKMLLYISAYGMTVLRVTTSAFMIFLAVVFFAVILHIYRTKINLILTALITAGCILTVLGTVGVGSLCARYNYESYLSGKLDSIDVSALYHLGDEGIPYLVKLCEDKNERISAEAKSYVSLAIRYRYFDDVDTESVLEPSSLKKKEEESGFSRFSIPKAKAYESLYEFLEENPDFYENEHKTF